ncbi:MAG: hypothetical protein RLZZ626_1085 [Actinomycetota bacterium]|jgi:hypothetical protein
MSDQTQFQGSQQPARTNTLAIIALATSVFGISLAGIICGHIALSQIKRTGEQGQGMALAGVILGYLGFVAGIVLLFAAIAALMSGAYMAGL